MRNTTLLIVLLVLLGGLSVGVFLLSREQTEIRATVAVAASLGGGVEGYDRALGPRPIVFPDDHGPHPAFKLEWWYFTGNLQAADGRPFGYQFTLFRSALSPPDPSRPARVSNWATNQLYLAHFTVTDVEGGRFQAFERYSRGAAGLAGAVADPFRIWLEDWSVEQAGAAMPAMRLRAADADLALDLFLDTGRPIVLQGDQGFSRKGPGEGQASYYYSMTRLDTKGTITLGAEQYPVEGLSWMDREWSTSMLGDTQLGWDWFSLQLDDGRDLMYFQLRERDPTHSPYTDGLLVAPDGTTRPLATSEVLLEVLDTWKSPVDGAVYPSKWRLRIPGEALDLTVVPYLADQELDVSVRYWEGAVRLEGTAAGRPIQGNGYVEMTGYGDNAGLPVS